MAINAEDIIKASYVKGNMTAETRDEAIKEMLNIEAVAGNIGDINTVFDAVLAREAEFTTKLMDDISIPHAKSAEIKRAMVVIGKSKNGIEWRPEVDYKDSQEKDRVKVVFMILVPGQQPGNEHLKILALLARCLSRKDFRESIIETEDPQTISAFLVEEIRKKQEARK
ncbi:MAG: PTS sugar transporter subunit IIA [Eubacteriaceae bacterium]|jgi:mannitol/fructose-specific phosphotransferase system IIA component (Ntr-type)|nr:PTS sugar transporter subunit IIA [Eubacteriaceae bacterium]